MDNHLFDSIVSLTVVGHPAVIHDTCIVESLVINSLEAEKLHYSLSVLFGYSVFCARIRKPMQRKHRLFRQESGSGLRVQQVTFRRLGAGFGLPSVSDTMIIRVTGRTPGPYKPVSPIPHGLFRNSCGNQLFPREFNNLSVS